ncbi:MAG TPA: hypothetical protein VGE26_05440 [Sphingobacteriaceae bacterium]
MDDNLTYNDHVLSICQALYSDMMWFIWCAADLALESDLKYLTEVFDEDEAIPVNTELLEAVDDPAVNVLTKWINKIDETLSSFHNLNLLSIEDITKNAPGQDAPVERAQIEGDRYTGTLKIAEESAISMQADILSDILVLAEHNPACLHLVEEYENGASWDVFADSADQNINLLYGLFNEAFAVVGDLYTIQGARKK